MFYPFHFINKIKLHYFEAIVILHTFCPVYCVQFYHHLSSFMKKLRSLWSSLQLRNDTYQRGCYLVEIVNTGNISLILLC